jgi:hypothetical protein
MLLCVADQKLLIAPLWWLLERNNTATEKQPHQPGHKRSAGEDDQQAAEATWLSCTNENRKSDNDNQRLSVPPGST